MTSIRKLHAHALSPFLQALWVRLGCPTASGISGAKFININRLHGFPFSALTLLVGRQEGHPARKKLVNAVGGDDFTRALQ